MKIIIFCSIIAAVSAAPTRIQGDTVPGFLCPVEDIVKGCDGAKDCLYPFPGDCSKYIECTVNDDKTGTPIEMECPPLLEWDDVNKICNWPLIAQCSAEESKPTPDSETTEAENETTESDEESTSEKTTNEEINTTEEAEESTTDAKIPEEPEETTTEAEKPEKPEESTTESEGASPGSEVCSDEDTKNGCIGPKECLYPNPDTCEGYLQCVEAPIIGWVPIPRPCPITTEWNDIIKECDDKSNSTCPKPKTFWWFLFKY